MSRVISVGTAELPYEYRQSDLKSYADTLLSRYGQGPGRMLDVFDSSLIETRGLVHPREWFESEKSFKERSESYLSGALTLSRSAIEDCLDKYGGDTGDFDHIIYVSSTGVSTPPIDAILINDVRLDYNKTPTPI